jgi:hypothetical protein
VPGFVVGLDVVAVVGVTMDVGTALGCGVGTGVGTGGAVGVGVGVGVAVGPGGVPSRTCSTPPLIALTEAVPGQPPSLVLLLAKVALTVPPSAVTSVNRASAVMRAEQLARPLYSSVHITDPSDPESAPQLAGTPTYPTTSMAPPSVGSDPERSCTAALQHGPAGEQSEVATEATLRL